MYTFVWFQLLSGCEFHLTADLSLERVILRSNFKFGLFRMNQTAADHGLSNVSWIWLPSFELVWCLKLWLSDSMCYKRETVTRRRSKEWTWYFSFFDTPSIWWKMGEEKRNLIPLAEGVKDIVTPSMLWCTWECVVSRFSCDFRCQLAICWDKITQEEQQ